MFEEIAAWAVGFFLAYLVIRALRSFGTRNMCFLGFLLLVPAVNAATTLTVYLSNSGASAETGATFWENGVQTFTFSTVSAGAVNNSQGFTWTTHIGWEYMVKNTAGTVCWTGTYINADPGGDDFGYLGGGNYRAPEASAVQLNVAPPVTYTNHISTITFTNTNSFAAEFELNVYTNGVIWTNTSGFFFSGEGFSHTLTNSTAFTWEIIGPTGLENLAVINSGSSTPSTGSTQFPNGGAYSPQSGNPFANVPQQGSGTIPTNSAVADRQNSEAITRAVQAQGDLDTKRIVAQLELNRTNSEGQSMDMGWTNILKEINTNIVKQSEAHNARLGGLTNLPGTNIYSLFGDMTNYATTNWNNSELKGVFDTLTNDYEGTFTEISSNYSDALLVPIGRGFTLNLNPIKELGSGTAVRNFDPARNAAYHLGQWLKYWLQWLIYLAAGWICFQRTWEHAKELLPQAFTIGNMAWSWKDLVAMALAPFTLGLSAAYPVIRRASSIIAVSLIVAAVATLPILGWILIGDLGFTLAFGGSFSQRIDEAMGHIGMLAVVTQVFYVFTFFFPITTFAIAVINVFGFRLYLVWLMMITWTALKGMYQVSTANQLNSDGSDRVEQLDQGYIDV